MEDNILQLVFTSVILGTVTHAIIAADKQGLGAFIRHAVRSGLYRADGPNLHQLVSDGKEALFARILANQHHVLRQLLPNSTHKYGLRSRRHNYTLNTKSETRCRNFITRLLYKDM